jgi:hypothetical protein
VQRGFERRWMGLKLWGVLLDQEEKQRLPLSPKAHRC